MKRLVLVLVVVCLLPAAAGAVETDHAFGLAYPRGVQDVFDEVRMDVELPVGFIYRPYWNFKGGMRVDFGVGPIIHGWGDAEVPLPDLYDLYLDIPFSGTVGFNFAPQRGVNPYVRGGLVFHVIEAEFSGNSTAGGVLAAGGFEFRNRRDVKVYTEVSYDSSEFEIARGFGAGENVKLQDLGFGVGVVVVL